MDLMMLSSPGCAEKEEAGKVVGDIPRFKRPMSFGVRSIQIPFSYRCIGTILAAHVGTQDVMIRPATTDISRATYSKAGHEIGINAKNAKMQKQNAIGNSLNTV